MGSVRKKEESRQNLTIQLARETIRRAKILAAQKGTSISGLVSQTLEDLVEKDHAYEAAMREELDRLKRGLHLGGGPLPRREELYDRKGLR